MSCGQVRWQNQSQTPKDYRFSEEATFYIMSFVYQRRHYRKINKSIKKSIQLWYSEYPALILGVSGPDIIKIEATLHTLVQEMQEKQEIQESWKTICLFVLAMKVSERTRKVLKHH